MNKHTIIGNVGQQPEIKKTESTTIANFTVACNRHRKNKETGETVQETDWIRCVAFGVRAELIEKYVNKGDRIAVIGRVSSRSYEDKDQVKRYVTETITDEIEFLTSKNEKTHSDLPANMTEASDDDDLPF